MIQHCPVVGLAGGALRGGSSTAPPTRTSSAIRLSLCVISLEACPAILQRSFCLPKQRDAVKRYFTYLVS